MRKYQYDWKKISFHLIFFGELPSGAGQTNAPRELRNFIAVSIEVEAAYTHGRFGFGPQRLASNQAVELDDLALFEALESDAFYVGVIGSARGGMRFRGGNGWSHFGQTAESLVRLRGPIGICIGSKTPPEIAVSVMAEISAVKNGVVFPREIEVGVAKEAVG